MAWVRERTGPTEWLKIADLECVASQRMITDEWWIAKDLEGRLRDVFEELCRCLLGRTEENYFDAQSC